MTERIRSGLIVAAFVLLGAAAIWGWSRKSAPAFANTGEYLSPVTTSPVTAQPVDAYGQPVSLDAQGRAMANGDTASAPCVSDVAYTPAPLYASRNYVRTIRQEPIATRPVTTEYLERDRYVPAERVHERSKKKSVAIVAGSAGVGAAVGAIAGGGKGAGIGALAGGAGGFIYDRLTHKRVR